MSFLRSGGSRRLRPIATVSAVTLVLGVLSVVGAGAASAFGAPPCQYNNGTDTVTVNYDGGDSFEVYVDINDEVRVFSGGELDCGAATAGNTAVVDILGDGIGNNLIEIENGNTDGLIANGFAVGAFANNTTFNVDLGEDPADNDTFWYHGGFGSDEVVLADGPDDLNGTVNGGNLNVTGMDQLVPFGYPQNVIALGDGDDSYDGDGSFANLAVYGGPGWDYVKPNLGPEALFGGQPDIGGFLPADDGSRGDTLDYDRGTTNAVSLSLHQDLSVGLSDADDGERCTEDDTFFGVPGNICEGDDVQGFRIIITGAGNDYLEDDEIATHTELMLPGLGDDEIFTRDDGDTLAFPSPCTGPVTVDSANGVATGCGTDTFGFIDQIAGSPNGPADFDPKADAITGGDTLDFSGETGPIEVDLENDVNGSSSFDEVREPNDNWNDPFNPYLPLLENVIGSPGDDEIFGNEEGNVLDGRAGNDEVVGDDGNDVLIGDAGNDTFTGGRGLDSVYFGRSSAGVLADLSLGFATGEGSDSFDPWADFIPADVELIWGSQFNDEITGGLTGFGSGLNFRFIGKGGNDLLTGADSNDTLMGGQGDDVMRGGGGLDILKGAQGEDWGYGGRGKDFCAKSTEHQRSC
jgi:hypothetical protein